MTTTDNTPPGWCEPGAASQTVELAAGDRIESWQRIISDDVWIAAEDHTIIERHMLRTPARIYVGEPPHAAASAASRLALSWRPALGRPRLTRLLIAPVPVRRVSGSADPLMVRVSQEAWR